MFSDLHLTMSDSLIWQLVVCVVVIVKACEWRNAVTRKSSKNSKDWAIRRWAVGCKMWDLRLVLGSWHCWHDMLANIFRFYNRDTKKKEWWVLNLVSAGHVQWYNNSCGDLIPCTKYLCRMLYKYLLSDWSVTRESRTWFNCFNNSLVTLLQKISLH